MRLKLEDVTHVYNKIHCNIHDVLLLCDTLYLFASETKINNQRPTQKVMNENYCLNLLKFTKHAR